MLEGSGRFADTRFLAPSTRDRETGRDRFSVGAHIEPAAGALSMARFPTRWLALALLLALVAIPLAGLGVALSGLWRADAEAAALADTAARFEGGRNHAA